MRQSKIVNISFSSEGTTELVSLTEAKAQCVISDSDTSFDDQITAIITSSRQWIEKITGVSMISRTVTAVIDYYDECGLPYGPVSTVSSVQYKTDIATYESLTADTDYEYSDGRFTSYKGPYRYKIIYTTTAESGLKQALLSEIAYRFEHKGDEIITGSPLTLALCEPYKDLEWLT